MGEKDGAQATVISAGLDYLTITAKEGRRAGALWAYGFYLCLDWEKKGFGKVPFNWQSYCGYTTGPITCGQRKDGSIVRVSGPTADTVFANAYDLADNVSRIDLQVTVQESKPTDNHAWRWYNAPRHQHQNGGRSAIRTVVLNTKGGSTLYVGARSSDNFGRLYDKWAESREPSLRNSWRWEWEAKGAAAVVLASALNLAAERRDYIISAVYERFRRWGIEPNWPTTGYQLRDRVSTLRNDDARRIAWLAMNVSATVKGLIKRRGFAEVIKALDIRGELDEYSRTESH